MQEQTSVETRKVIKRILAGTDFSRPGTNAAVRAAMLAAEHSAGIEIVHVTTSSDSTSPRSFEDWSEELNSLVLPFGITVHIKVVVGDPARMLAIEATRFNADLVVLGNRKTRSSKGALIGTTAEQFFQKWNGDILFVKEFPARRYATVLACVPLSSRLCSVVNSALALSTVADVSVLHVYQPPFEKILLGQHAGSKVVKKNRAIARQEMMLKTTELLQHCALRDDREVKIILKRGNRSSIPVAASRSGADVIAVGGSTSLIKGFIFGDTSRHVLRSTYADVLVSRSADLIREVPK